MKRIESEIGHKKTGTISMPLSSGSTHGGNSSVVVSRIRHILSTELGTPKERRPGQYVFTCPVCNKANKKKLEVNLDSNSNNFGSYRCWVCADTQGIVGTKPTTLARKLNFPDNKRVKLRELWSKVAGQYVNVGPEITESVILTLPEHSEPLFGAKGPVAKACLSYLEGRGLSQLDIYRLRVHYVTEGKHRGQVVFPSYIDGKLDYYVGKMALGPFKHYSLPKVIPTKPFMYEHVSGDRPIVLCEGIFDALAIKYNAIPLLTKGIRTHVAQYLTEINPPKVLIALDADARKDAIYLAKRLSRWDIPTSLILLEDGDPADMGTARFWQYAVDNVKDYSLELEILGMIHGYSTL